MMTEQQLQTAHIKVKTAADFSKYIEDIMGLGMMRCEYIVKDGVVIYFDEYRYRVKSEPMYEPLIIADRSSEARLRNAIALYKERKIDFPAFCHHAAEAGVENWVIDTQRMRCIYYDQAGARMAST